MVEGQKLTVEDGKRALADHVLDKAAEVQAKYGLDIDYSAVMKILQDPDFVRFPTEIKFDSSKIDEGLFAITEMEEDEETGNKCVLYIHEYFKDREEDLPLLILYHIVAINYGDFASAHDAELFASAILAMDQDVYYQKLCDLADELPNSQETLSRIELEEQLLNGDFGSEGGGCGSGSCGCQH